MSRRDLLNVFLRPDPDITADVQQVLDEILPSDPERVTAAVRHGVVTLTGTIEPAAARRDPRQAMTSLIADVAGVVDVVNSLTVVWPSGTKVCDQGRMTASGGTTTSTKTHAQCSSG